MDILLIVIIISFGILAITGIVFLIVSFFGKKTVSAAAKSCLIDSDCGQNETCGSDGKCAALQQQKKICQVSSDISQLESCNIGDNAYCSDNCSNTPTFGCVQVDDDNPYNWSQGVDSIQVPSAPKGKGWCLPPVVTSSNCSPQSSDPILYKIDDNYFWGCRCKYNFLKAGGTGENCNIVSPQVCSSATGYEGQLYVTDNKQCSGDSDCGQNNWCNEGKCYYNWPTRLDLDPTQGICRCSSEQLSLTSQGGSNNYEFSCATDQCSPGTTITNSDGTKSCTGCPIGYFQCPEQMNPNSKAYSFCKTNGPRCLKDPCPTSGSGQNNFWDPNEKSCNCGNLVTSGSDNFFGSECIDPCIGKCIGRGTCQPKGTEGDYTCENCTPPWTQDPSGKCLKSCNTSGQFSPAEECCSGSNNAFGFCN